MKLYSFGCNYHKKGNNKRYKKVKSLKYLLQQKQTSTKLSSSIVREHQYEDFCDINGSTSDNDDDDDDSTYMEEIENDDEDQYNISLLAIKDQFTLLGLPEYLQSIIGGNKSISASTTILNGFVNFLAWTKKHKTGDLLQNNECIEWMQSILDSNYMLLSSYIEYMKTKRSAMPGTIRNHVYFFKDVFAWYLLTYEIDSSRIVKFNQVLSRCSKHLNKESKKIRIQKGITYIYFLIHTIYMYIFIYIYILISSLYNGR
jgi:hypothetical protein